MLNFKDKKVLIFGLGLNSGGLGMAKFFAKSGAQVTITDTKTADVLSKTISQLSNYKNIIYHLGAHQEEDFLSTDFVVRNPSVRPDNPFLQLAQKNHKPILMEIPLFMQLCPCPIVGITGTKGKSTTTNLIYQLLKTDKSKKVYLAGNIGKSAISLLSKLTKNDLVVLEISSFHLDSFDFCQKSPQYSVLTNLKNDHTDWHGSLELYHQAKLNIFKFQNKNDWAFINLDDPGSLKYLNKIPSQIASISTLNPKANYFLNSNQEVLENGNPLFNLKSKLFFETNKYNLLQAIAVSRILKIPSQTIQKVIAKQKPLTGRLEYLGNVHGVDFYNDTCATNPESVALNLVSLSEKYGNRIIHLAGGMDKNFNYQILKNPILNYTKALVLLAGTGSEKINEILKDSGHPIYSYYHTLNDAVDQALSLSTKGDCVVLSPGATSFNLFQNEFDRGNQFIIKFHKLKNA